MKTSGPLYDYTDRINQFLGDWPFWVFFSLFIGSVVLRSWTLGAPSIHLDEAYTLFLVQQSWGEIWGQMKLEANPPLSFFLLKIWTSLFGDSEVAARSLSVLFAAAVPGVVYLFGRRFLSPATGILAAIWVMASNQHLYYAQEIRYYSMVVFFAVCAFYCLASWLETGNRKPLVWLCIFNACLLYTHYVPLLILPAQFLAILFFERRKHIWKYVLGQLAVGISVLPLILWMTPEKATSTATWLAVPGWEKIPRVCALLLGSDYLLPVSVVFLLLGTVFLCWKKLDGEVKPAGKWWAFLSLWGIGILALAFGVSRVTPMFLPKYLLFVSPGLYLLLAYALTQNPLHRYYKLVATGALIGLLGYHFQIQQPKGENWREGVSWIKEVRQSGGAVIVTPVYHFRSLAYYYDLELFRDYTKTFESLMAEKVFFMDALDPQFFKFQQQDEVILLLGQGVTIPTEKAFLSQLNTRYQQVETRQTEGIQWILFRR